MGNWGIKPTLSILPKKNIRMYEGSVIQSLDDKGRLIIPAKFRRNIPAEANGKVHIILGRDSCLWLYDDVQWLKTKEKLLQLDEYAESDTRLLRQFLYHAEEFQIDAQFRILLSQKTMQVVNIKKEVLLIGQLNKVEIWNPETFDIYLQSSGQSYEDVMEKVLGKKKSPVYPIKN